MTTTNGERAPAEHVWPVRVYYEDTDAAGVVYHANYLRFAERARTEMLRAHGVDQGRLRAERGLAFAVRDCAIDYRAPARLDDALEVRTRAPRVGAASVRLEQTIRRGAAVLARLELRIACVDADGRPARLPAAVRAAARAHCVPRSPRART